MRRRADPGLRGALRFVERVRLALRASWGACALFLSREPEGVRHDVEKTGSAEVKCTSVESHSQAELTQLLSDESLDDTERARRLLPLVYEQLRGLARRHMAAERSDHTLQATALVHEAYVKLVDRARDAPWQGRAHFYAAAAEAMRRILLDHARGRLCQKRVGNRRQVSMSLADVAQSWDYQETLSLDAALSRLSEQRPSVAEVVRLRFFAGLSVEETAQTMELSPATVKRRWEFGRTWLFRELSRGDGDGG